MKVLVTAASKNGATDAIAHAIAEALAERGLDVTVAPPEHAGSIEDFDAVVLGSAVYTGHWLEPAKKLTHRLSKEDFQFALDEADLHRAALEVRPALRDVDRVLLEAEHLTVEAARGVEVADVVPDGRPSAHYSARPGSSRKVLIVFRNSAPVAPSTAR